LVGLFGFVELLSVIGGLKKRRGATEIGGDEILEELWIILIL